MNKKEEDGKIEQSLEDMAEEIGKLCAIGAKLANSRLKRRAVVLLLKDLTGVPMTSIEKILDGLEAVGKEYLKPKKGKK